MPSLGGDETSRSFWVEAAGVEFWVFRPKDILSSHFQRSVRHTAERKFENLFLAWRQLLYADFNFYSWLTRILLQNPIPHVISNLLRLLCRCYCSSSNWRLSPGKRLMLSTQARLLNAVSLSLIRPKVSEQRCTYNLKKQSRHKLPYQVRRLQNLACSFTCHVLQRSERLY